MVKITVDIFFSYNEGMSFKIPSILLQEYSEFGASLFHGRHMNSLNDTPLFTVILLANRGRLSVNHWIGGVPL